MPVRARARVALADTRTAEAGAEAVRRDASGPAGRTAPLLGPGETASGAEGVIARERLRLSAVATARASEQQESEH